MAEEYINCPGCGVMLLGNTIQCPSCAHVLDEKHLAQWQNSQALTSRIPDDPCPSCGEMVKRGLVRCWNCSSFMRPEIEEAYRQLQAAPRPVIYSPLPAGSSPPKTSPADSTADEEDEETYKLAPPPPPAEEPPPPPAEAVANNANGDQPPPPPGEGEPTAEAEDGVPHSVATGGDALLRIAMNEGAEEKKRKRRRRRKRYVQPRSRNGVLLFCPNGHRIEVDVKYRGKQGRCPKCKAPFLVPLEEKPEASEATSEETAEPAPETGIGKYTHWLSDVRLHSVNPERLKLKPGSLKNDFQLFDIGFADDEVLLVTLTKRKGAAPAKSKKQAEDREKLHDYLRTGGPLEDLPAVEHFTLTTEQAKTIAVAQPPLYPHESLFADVPVFGEGIIAVKIPYEADPKVRRFASFTLSEFREFAEILDDLYGVEDLGSEVDIPLTDSFTEAECHYSEEKFSFLEHPEFYQADPQIELQLVGRKCQGCGLIVSEDSRKKEKIGGANGKGIAKAKCPKCQQKFGDISLYTVETTSAEIENDESDVAEMAASS